jgi:tetratricopeptide (TPR) repeat protein
MGKFIDAFARSKPRLLAMSPFIAAGALASVAMPPSLATGALIAVLQTLGNLAGNIAAADMHAALADRVLRGDVLKNHDLARATRDAIGAVIHAAAQEISDEKQRAALERMARVEASVWAEAEATLRQPQTIEGLSADDTLEMFSKSPEEFAKFKALDFEAWRDIAGGLAAANSFALEGDVLSAPGNLKLSGATVDLVATRLHETFPRALYEILKEDFAHDGKAYGGLLIKLVGNISARQVETWETAHEILNGTRNIVERMEGKVDQLLATGEQTKGQVAQVLEKLDSFQGQTASSTPPRLAINLPPYNQIFTGREEVLDALKAELEQSGRAAFSGMPGVGKTQTATAYAHRQYAAEAYDYVLYARAASETELLTDFVGAAQALNLPGKGDANFNVVAASVKAWLEGAERWLLIFDNADDLSVVRSHLPANPRGHTLFTRRPDDATTYARTIKIDTMDEDEGALLLLRRAELVKGVGTLDSVAPEMAKQARAIAHELDGLPLSLDIAGAFIKGTSTPLDEYLRLYRAADGRELRRQRDDLNADYEHSVAAAFSLAFKQVATPTDDSEESAIIARAAADLLRLCAFLAPDAIPLELILTDDSELGEDLQRALGNPIWRKKTIAKATRYSLLDANTQSQTYDMHREVQAVMRDEMDNEAQRLWADRALQSLLSALPDVEEFANWETCDLLVPHAQACLEHSDNLKIETEAVARLKTHTGFHLENRARYEEVEPLYAQALQLMKKLFGEEHPDVALMTNNLAELYHAQGRYEQAEPLLEQALELRRRLRGEEHPEIAASINNLAALYHVQGRYEEAELLFEKSLKLWKKLFGTEHPGVTHSLNNLAELYRVQERYEEAKPLLDEALELTKRLRGEEHPDVAISMNNLALLYHAQEQYEEAESLFEQALAMFERTLGVNHPSTSIVRANFELFRIEKALWELKQGNVGGDEGKDNN